MKISHLFTCGAFGILMFFSSELQSQQVAQFSMYMNNKLFYNPAYAGIQGNTCATLIGRHQWVGFEGNPRSYIVSGSSYLPQLHGGVGMSLLSDQLGSIKTFGAKASYSFITSLGRGKLGMGLAIGAIRKSIDNRWKSIDPWQLDPQINSIPVNKFTFDADLGFYYTIPHKLYVGFSGMHLPSSKIKDNHTAEIPKTFNYQIIRHYTLLAGSSHNISGTNFTIAPSLMAKTDGASAQIDLSSQIWFQNQFSIGASYRLQDALVAMLGFKRNLGSSTLNIGYSYDITTSRLKSYSAGSHELQMSFCFGRKEEIICIWYSARDL